MTKQYTEEQKEKAIELLTEKGDFYIMPLEEFVAEQEPCEIHRLILLAGLNLDCKYIRVNPRYKDAEEADAVGDLISDYELGEALNELQ